MTSFPLSLCDWPWIHKWSSLVCAVFLLLLCITGLPLVFGNEIGDWAFPDDDVYAVMPPDTPHIGIDQAVAAARRMYPGQVVTTVREDAEEPKIVVWMASSWAELKADREREKPVGVSHWIKFDARTGEVLERSTPPGQEIDTRSWPRRAVGVFQNVMFRLHVDLYAKFPGQMFLAVMGALFVIATVSGVMLYAPFMRKLDFGTVRGGRIKRIKWLDLHNLLGVVTLTWVLVVGISGVLNQLARPLVSLANANITEAIAPWRGRPVPAQNEMVSPQRAFDVARGATPGMLIESLNFPNDDPGNSPYHYKLFAKGQDKVGKLLFKTILVEARTGKVSKVFALPWYLTALQLSRPLHFGDYGGLPLKFIWALLDLVTIVVLGSGLYLWRARRKSSADAIEAAFNEHDGSTVRLPRPEAAE